MSPDASSNTTPRLHSALIVAASIAIPAILLARVFLNFRYQFSLTHVEGAWLACASDFVHGVFYRPLFGPLGYGGTRYFPLYFVLTGVFSRIFGSLETSGLALSLASIVLLCYAAYVAMRSYNVNLLLRAAGVTAILAVATTQQALLGTKADPLAAMLNLWGVVLCLKPKISRASLYIAALLFTLAFATKLTTVFGVAAVVLGWALARRYKEALQLALATAGGYMLVLAAMYFGSDGRVLGIFRACASGGGSLSYTLQAPIHMLSKALEVDPIFSLFLIPAAACCLASYQEDKTRILPNYFVLALLVATVIFGSPGIGINHLLDLHVAAILLIVIFISQSPQFAEAGTVLLALSFLVAIVPTAQNLHGDLHRRSFSADAQQAVQRIPSLGGTGGADAPPILAENPLVVLKAGKTPYVADPFMFRILARTHPALAKNFWEKMTHRGFSAVILQKDPSSAEGNIWYTDMHFGGEFLQDLDANYALSYTVGQMYVYTPKPAQPQRPRERSNRVPTGPE
jgi:hypothetical protein